MDRRERIADEEETLRMALEGHQGRIWTALPGIINSFDASAMTCTVKPAISLTRRFQDGIEEAIELPLLLDCPVCFPGGGGCTLTFPIKAGDECLVVFSSRCIDAWWQLGGVRGQAEYRLHDLSDGFVLPGVRSQPRKFSVNTAAAELRSDDGAIFIRLDPSAKTLVMTAPNGATINANVSINGTLHVSGTITSDADVIGNGTSLHNHTHPNVQTGTSSTGAPT